MLVLTSKSSFWNFSLLSELDHFVYLTITVIENGYKSFP